MKKVAIALVLLVIVVPMLAAAAAAMGLYYLIASIPQWLLAAVIAYLLFVIAQGRKRERASAQARLAVETKLAELAQREALASQTHAMRVALAERQMMLEQRAPASPKPISAPEPWSMR